MNILHLNSERSWRGGEQQLAYLIEGLEQYKVRNVVLASKDSALGHYCNLNGQRVYYSSYSNGFNLSTVRLIKKIIKNESIDLVHAHTSKAHTQLLIYLLTHKHIPVVITRRVDFKPKTHLWNRLKYNHKAIKKVVCVSRFIENIMDVLVEKSKLTTIHSGVDRNRFAAPSGYLKKEYQLSENTKLIGNTSALADHKDYFTFIDTAGYLLQRTDYPVKFFIIGEGSLRNELVNYVHTKGLEDTVIFTGFITEINKILPELDVFLMTSKMEGLGTSILDAFAAGVPVVATKTGGITEMVEHGKNGMLANTGDASQLADNVKYFIENESYTSSIISNAYIALNEFSKEKMAQKYYELYSNMILEK